MSIEDDIRGLLKEAEPLRGLDADDPRAAGLAGLVDEINRLRAIQAKEAEAEALRALEEPKRGPGRPKKGEQ